MKRFHFSAVRYSKVRENMLTPDAALELPSVEAARTVAEEALREIVGELPHGPAKVAVVVRDDTGAVVEGVELEIRSVKPTTVS